MMKYPETKQIDVEENYFGTILKDPYRWLHDAKNEETLAWVQAENAYTDDYFKQAHIDIEKKMAQLKAQSENQVSYSSIQELGDALYASKALPNGAYEMVKLTKDFKEVCMMCNDATFDNAFVVYSLRMSPLDNGIGYVHAGAHGADRPSVLVYDFNQGKVIKRLDGIFPVAWDNKGEEVLYSDCDVDVEHQMTINHYRGYHVYTDTINHYYTYPNNAIMINVEQSQDAKTLVGMVGVDYSNYEIVTIDHQTKEVHSLTNGNVGEFQYIGTEDDTHYFMSRQGAPKGCVVAVQDDMDKARVVVPEGNNTLMEVKCFQGNLILNYQVDVASQLLRYTLQGEFIDEIALPDTYGCVNIMEVNEAHMYLSYESFVTSPSVYCYDGKNLKCCFKKREADASDIVVEQIFAPSRDGVRIPAFVIHRKDFVKNGNCPTVMYGYGGYNISMPPTFHNPFIGMDIIDWVMEGNLYAHVNLRGGNEYGSEWHEAGYLDKKKNCFYDFIGVTEYLIQQHYTCPGKIAITGGSNGGLLMTALTTMRPDLWGCVIASVPHTDMIHFMNDDRGPMYITEYGNPKEEKMFHYMLSYSPYHNIRTTTYPPMYIQTGECDNNVPPYHGKKFAAKMQALNQSEEPIVLRVLKMGSHDRGKGDVYYQTTAEMQSFIHYHLIEKAGK